MTEAHGISKWQQESLQKLDISPERLETVKDPDVAFRAQITTLTNRCSTAGCRM